MQESVYGFNFTGLVERHWTQKPYPVIVKAGVDDTSRDNSNVGKQIVCQRVKCALDQRKFVWKGWGTSDTFISTESFSIAAQPFHDFKQERNKEYEGRCGLGFPACDPGSGPNGECKTMS